MPVFIRRGITRGRSWVKYRQQRRIIQKNREQELLDSESELISEVESESEPVSEVESESEPVSEVESESETSTGFETETETLLAAMTVEPDATRQGHINTLIAGLKADGIWNKLDALYLMAAHDQQAARLNWKNPATFTLEDAGAVAPSFTVDQGFIGDSNGSGAGGTRSRLTTGFAMDAGTNFLRNSACLFAWTLNNLAESILSMGCNAGIGSPRISGNPRNAVDGALANINDTGGFTQSGQTDSRGIFLMNRSGASATQMYKNGSSIGTGNSSSVALPSSEIAFVGTNTGLGSGTTTSSGRRHAVGGIGGSLDATDNANLHARLSTYLTAIGVI